MDGWTYTLVVCIGMVIGAFVSGGFWFEWGKNKGIRQTHIQAVSFGNGRWTVATDGIAAFMWNKRESPQRIADVSVLKEPLIVASDGIRLEKQPDGIS